MYAEEVYKTALSSDDDKRLQTFDNTTTHLNKTNAFKLCESEVLMVMKYKDLLLNDKNHIKETNTIFKIIVAKCILKRFRKSEMFNVMKYKDFLTDNIDHIKKQTVFLRWLMQRVQWTDQYYFVKVFKET